MIKELLIKQILTEPCPFEILEFTPKTHYLTVAHKDGKYYLINGHMRLKLLKASSWRSVTCEVVECQ